MLPRYSGNYKVENVEGGEGGGSNDDILMTQHLRLQTDNHLRNSPVTSPHHQRLQLLSHLYIIFSTYNFKVFNCYYIYSNTLNLSVDFKIAYLF